MNKQRKKNRCGFSLIEIILVIVMMLIFSGAFYSLDLVNSFSVEKKINNSHAINYAREGLEVVRNIKYENYLSLQDGDYYLSESSGDYSLVSGGIETISDFYTRAINIAPVYRNAANQIDENGENLDNLTKKITVTVSWEGPFNDNKSIVVQEFLADWQGISWIQTTKSHFDAGVNSNTIVYVSDPIIPDNGKIELEPAVAQTTYLGTANVYERAKGIFYKDNVVYVAVAKASGGLCSVGVTDPLNVVELDCIDIGAKANNLVVSGNYAYVVQDSKNKGLAIVDISDPENLDLVSTLDVYDYAKDIDIQGNYVYLAVDHWFYSMVIVNVSNPSSPFVASNAIAFGVANAIEVSGNYAFLSLDNTLQVFNVANVNFPYLTSLAIIGYECGGSVFRDNYLFLAVKKSDAGLYILDYTNIAWPSLVDAIDVGNIANDVDISDDYLYVAVDENAAGAAVYDISDSENVTFLENVDIGGKGNSVHSTSSYIYYAVDTALQGVAILTKVTTQLQQDGNFTSKIHDTGSELYTYKNINWLSSDPPGTEIKFQIRTADTELGISAAEFVGSDGTNSTYYTVSPAVITLSPTRSGQRYIQWRAFFGGDGNSSSSLEEVTIKYE